MQISKTSTKKIQTKILGLSFHKFSSNAYIPNRTDCLVIGGGIGGSSISYELSKQGLQTICVEQESSPGYHSTGRAAGLFSENYGSDSVKILSLLSRKWFENPPSDCITSDQSPFLTPSGLLAVSEPENQEAMLLKMGPLPSFDNSYFAKKSRENVKLISKETALVLNPLLNEDLLGDIAVFEENATLLDIPLIHQSYLRGCKRNNVPILCNQQVDYICKLPNNNWEVITNINSSNERRYEAGLIVNAAGAWADEIAILTGLYNENTKLQITPLRRAIIVFPREEQFKNIGISFTFGIDGDGKEFWYLAPQGKSGLFLASPANRDEDEACDAHVTDYEVALCVDRIETYTKLKVNKIKNKWAGLRCHSKDGNFVIGPDEKDNSFIWVAGLAGQGVQAAPGYSQLCAKLAMQENVPQELQDMGFDLNHVSPNRFEKKQFL